MRRPVVTSVSCSAACVKDLKMGEAIAASIDGCTRILLGRTTDEVFAPACRRIHQQSGGSPPALPASASRSRGPLRLPRPAGDPDRNARTAARLHGRARKRERVRAARRPAHCTTAEVVIADKGFWGRDHARRLAATGTTILSPYKTRT